MAYSAEKDFIIKELHRAAVLFCECPAPERIASKSAFDVVTDIDTGVEAKLIKAIKFTFPEDTIISEEKYPRVKPGERTWVIDPIDGTSNMAHGSPLYGLQAAFCVNGEPVLAAMNLPGLGLKLHAIKGEGAYLNNKRIELKPFESTLSTVSFGDFSHKSVKVAKAQARAMRKLYPLLGKIRMFGAACIDFSFAAMGVTDGAVLLAKKPWDVLPGALLCAEAGLKVTNLGGEPYKTGDFGILALREEIYDTVKQYMIL